MPIAFVPFFVVGGGDIGRKQGQGRALHPSVGGGRLERNAFLVSCAITFPLLSVRGLFSGRFAIVTRIPICHLERVDGDCVGAGF